MANDLSVASEPARWIKLRASAAERARWQALAASRGVSLSELIRASLGSLRLRARRAPPRSGWSCPRSYFPTVPGHIRESPLPDPDVRHCRARGGGPVAPIRPF